MCRQKLEGKIIKTQELLKINDTVDLAHKMKPTMSTMESIRLITNTFN